MNTYDACIITHERKINTISLEEKLCQENYYKIASWNYSRISVCVSDLPIWRGNFVNGKHMSIPSIHDCNQKFPCKSVIKNVYMI